MCPLVPTRLPSPGVHQSMQSYAHQPVSCLETNITAHHRAFRKRRPGHEGDSRTQAAALVAGEALVVVPVGQVVQLALGLSAVPLSE